MSFDVSDIRKIFIEYFSSKGHKEIESSSLVPENDPTLMFTNCGMVQFKDVFTNKKTMPYSRAMTVQKCLRAGGKHNDLENVGYTARHHTFFEMLGNFSFGDYFKEDAIRFAWEFVTQNLGFQKEKLIVTVHSSDEEAAQLWKKISGLQDGSIIRINTNDNFWSMGDVGPCGPCSEIFYDHGENIAGGLPGSAEQDGDRFVEIWNLVFMQFEMMPDESKVSLPKKSIDTGMGLERIAAVLQGVHNNYDIDLFQNIISDIKLVTKKEDQKFISNNQVIADHIRAISFMIADGVAPASDLHGYVLRKILRRAIGHGYIMGVREPFLFKLVESVVKNMSQPYIELVQNRDYIQDVVAAEEKKFFNTIENGMHVLKKELKKLGTANVFPASIAYKLQDTHGLPIEFTKDILKSENKIVDLVEFEKIVQEEKEESKKNWTGFATNGADIDKIWHDIKNDIGEVEFVRGTQQLKAKILYIIKDSEKIDIANVGEKVFVVTDKTPFYAESGGQVGDMGWINGRDVVVLDTKNIAGIVAHSCVIINSSLKVGDEVELCIDWNRRRLISDNHTAIHVLQDVLCYVLNGKIEQRGSYCDEKKLRFDFWFQGSIDNEQLPEITTIIKWVIAQKWPVIIKEMSKNDAIKMGAKMLLGKTYPDIVRVVNINKSIELCGGEHVQNTGEIGNFIIKFLRPIGDCIYRIECLTGYEVNKWNIEKTRIEQQGMIALVEKQEKLLLEKENAELESEKKKRTEKLADEELQKFADFAIGMIFSENVGDVAVRYVSGSNLDNKVVLRIIDSEKRYDGKSCLLVFNKVPKKNVAVSVFVSKKLLEKITAIDVAKFAIGSLNLSIKVGGRNDLAQFGQMPADKIDEFIDCVKKIVID